MLAKEDTNKHYKGRRIRLFPDKKQSEFLEKCIDANRFVYNWALEQEIENEKLYEAQLVPNRALYEFDLIRRYKHLRDQHPFLQEVPFNVGQGAIRRVVNGMKMYFNKASNNKHPKFHSKKKEFNPSFELNGDRMYFIGTKIKIENIRGNGKQIIETKYDGPQNAKFTKSSISRDRFGNYYLSYNVEEDKPLKYLEDIPKTEPLGIDTNMKKRFVCSDGTIYYGPDLSSEMRIIKKCNRRRQKYVKLAKERLARTKSESSEQQDEPELSKRAKRNMQRLKRTYKRITDKNESCIQQATKRIIDKHPEAIIMEDLDVSDILSDKFVAKNVNNAAFFRCRQVMEYKCNWYGIPFYTAPKEYKSSQICSNCGAEKKIYTQKTYICHHCGMREDRDINAAKNLVNYYKTHFTIAE